MGRVAVTLPKLPHRMQPIRNTQRNVEGGGTGIRTLEGLAPLTVFKTVTFVRSVIPPWGVYSRI